MTTFEQMVAALLTVGAIFGTAIIFILFILFGLSAWTKEHKPKPEPVNVEGIVRRARTRLK